MIAFVGEANKGTPAGKAIKMWLNSRAVCQDEV